MVREPSPALLRLQRRLLKGFLLLVVGYPLYLLLLGPFCALGEGVFDFVPQRALIALILPAAPVCMIPGLRSSSEDYLTWWHDAQNTTQ